MNLIDKILEDWCCQSVDGCPNVHNQKDLAVLEHILKSDYKWNSHIINEFTSTLKLHEKIAKDEFMSRAEEVLKGVMNTGAVTTLLGGYNDLSEKSKLQFQKLFRSLSIGKFISSYSKIHSAFPTLFRLAKGSESTSTDMGKGEALMIALIKDSSSGGISDKDIKIGNGFYEVKQLDSSNRGLRIGGKEGNLANSPAIARMGSLIKLISESNIAKQKSKLAKLIRSHIDDDTTARILAHDKINPVHMQAVYDLSISLNEMLKRPAGEGNSVLTVDNEKDYLISKPDAEKIKPDSKVSIEIGPEVESSNEELLIEKLTKHPYVQRPKQLPDDIFLIATKYFSHIKGLILFDKDGKEVWLYSSPIDNGFKIVPGLVTEGAWKFQLRNDTKFTIFNDMGT